MKIFHISFALFVVISLTSCSSKISMDKNIHDINKRLNNYLESQLKEDQFPGIQYVIFNKDKILYEYAGGMARIVANKKMTSSSIINVFSTTKIITAIAILQLAQNGQLSLDDDIKKYFPSSPYKGVSIRNVLSHSSGIPNTTLGNFYIHWVDEHDNFDRNAYLQSVIKENNELKFKPGQDHAYSNMGYAILGRIIENISGLKYEEYVIKHIFNKLKLDKHKINFGSQQQPHSALPYFKRSSFIYNIMVMLLDDHETRDENTWTAINKPFYFNYPSHGGILASASEFSNIFIDLLKKEQSKLLSSDSIKQLFTLQSQHGRDSVAISWFKDYMQDTSYFYHQGSGMGYIAEVRIYPKQNIGSIVLMNRTDNDKLSMLDSLDSEYLSHLKMINMK